MENISSLARRLKQEVQGDVLFDDFSRGRYSTDASIYQLMPIGVVIPKSCLLYTSDAADE